MTSDVNVKFFAAFLTGKLETAKALLPSIDFFNRTSHSDSTHHPSFALLCLWALQTSPREPLEALRKRYPSTPVPEPLHFSDKETLILHSKILMAEAVRFIRPENRRSPLAYILCEATWISRHPHFIATEACVHAINYLLKGELWKIGEVFQEHASKLLLTLTEDLSNLKDNPPQKRSLIHPVSTPVTVKKLLQLLNSMPSQTKTKVVEAVLAHAQVPKPFAFSASSTCVETPALTCRQEEITISEFRKAPKLVPS